MKWVKKMDKRIITLLAIIAILSVALGYVMINNQETPEPVVNNTTAVNNTTVKNATLEESETETASSENTESGQYGYCAICGRALTSSEANHEITQGKVCLDCANNPYYQTDEGAKYANEKLFEAYPDEYEWMHEDANDNNKQNDDED